MILIGILYLLFASTFTFSKAALAYVAPFFLVAIRFIIAGILLLTYQYIWQRQQFRCDRADYRSFLEIGIIGCYLAFITDCWALQYISSAKACLIYNLTPFATAIIAYFLSKHTITIRQLLALIFGFVSFVPMFIGDILKTDSDEFLINISSAELVLMISVTCGAYGWIVMKRLVVQKGYSPIMINGVGLLGAGIIALIHSLLVEGIPSIRELPAHHVDKIYNWLAHIVPSSYLAITTAAIHISLLIIIAHIICYNLYGYMLKKYSATFLAFAGFTAPLFAALLGAVFLGESISISFVVIFIAVSIALYIFYLDEKQ